MDTVYTGIQLSMGYSVQVLGQMAGQHTPNAARNCKEVAKGGDGSLESFY